MLYAKIQNFARSWFVQVQREAYYMLVEGKITNFPKIFPKKFPKNFLGNIASTIMAIFLIFFILLKYIVSPDRIVNPIPIAIVAILGKQR